MIAPNRRLRKKKPKRRKEPSKQSLRFTPYAWAKLLFLRDIGDTEVGMFGISAPDDLLLIENVALVRQICTPVTVEFDDASVADHFDEQVDLGRTPEQFARVWLHTHPGSCPNPSGTDEETFSRVFGPSQWAIMFILAEEGATYCRLRFNVGPATNKRLGVSVDFQTEFPETDQDLWEAEYEAAVIVHDPFMSKASFNDRCDDWYSTEWVAS